MSAACAAILISNWKSNNTILMAIQEVYHIIVIVLWTLNRQGKIFLCILRIK